MSEEIAQKIEEQIDPADLAQAGGDFNDFASTLTKQFEGMVQESYKAPANMKEAFAAFTSAIDWSERWIQALGCFHVLNFLFFIFMRNDVDVQSIQFLVICALVLVSEPLNSYAANLCEYNGSIPNEKCFATQNYFDKQGTFLSAIFSAPLLIVGFCQLINFLKLAGTALIASKKMELKRLRQAEVKKTDGDGDNKKDDDSGDSGDVNKGTKEAKKADTVEVKEVKGTKTKSSKRASSTTRRRKN